MDCKLINSKKILSKMDENLEKVFSNLLDKDTYEIKFEDDNYKVSVTFSMLVATRIGISSASSTENKRSNKI